MKYHAVLIAALAAFALAGCRKPAAPSAPESKGESTSAPVEKAPASNKLSIFCWSEYLPQSVIDQFTNETGIQVSVRNYSSNEELLAKLLAGGESYDIIQPGDYVLSALVKDNLLRPLNHAMLPNLRNISPQFLNLPFDPGNKFSVPFMAGTVGIVVNTDVVKDEIQGFADVFQEKYRQKIVVLDDPREIVTWAMLARGIPINEVTDENLAKVKPLLAKWLPLVKIYDSDSPKTALLNGEAALGVVWGGEAAILLGQDKKFKWVLPSEGTHLFVDSLAIPKGAPNAENAEVFMNFILRPDISKQISDAFPYLNPNLPARGLLTAAQRANPASFPTDDEISKMQTFEEIGPQSSKVEEIVTSLKVP